MKEPTCKLDSMFQSRCSALVAPKNDWPNSCVTCTAHVLAANPLIELLDYLSN